jgi:polar amino acid transport system permease protein
VTTAAQHDGADGAAIEAVPVRHPGRAAAGAVLLLLLAWLVVTIARNDSFEFGVVPDYLFDRVVLDGVWLTIELTVVSMVLGLVIGVAAAVGRLSENPVLRWTAAGYIWLFRGTPVLVQLVFWFNIGIIFPTLGITLPFVDVTLFSVDANSVVTPMNAAILGLGLNSGSYIAEIVRAGITSVGRGQVEAAYALGLDPRRTLRRIVLPQAIPVAVPPLGNEFVSMLKYSALASVIAVPELLGSVEQIYATNLRTLELLVVASIWYLALTTVFSFLQSLLERRLSRGRVGISTVRARRRPLVRKASR